MRPKSAQASIPLKPGRRDLPGPGRASHLLFGNLNSPALIHSYVFCNRLLSSAPSYTICAVIITLGMGLSQGVRRECSGVTSVDYFINLAPRRALVFVVQVMDFLLALVAAKPIAKKRIPGSSRHDLTSPFFNISRPSGLTLPFRLIRIFLVGVFGLDGAVLLVND